MDNLLIKSKKEEFYSYPRIDFNSETGLCLISGVSFMEAADVFYKPVFVWLDKYLQSNKSIFLIFKVRYYNTSTSKIYFDLFSLLKKHENSGVKVQVEWHLEELDDDLCDDINDLVYDTEIKINIKVNEQV